MTTVHINARDHEEAHVASAKFLLPAADLRRAEAEVARQLAVTVRWAEEKDTVPADFLPLTGSMNGHIPVDLL